MPNEKAILAGGCFWGMQELFRHQPGVVSTRVGYSGGDAPNATYRNHGTHAESIKVVYDPEKTDFRALLECRRRSVRQVSPACTWLAEWSEIWTGRGGKNPQH